MRTLLLAASFALATLAAVPARAQEEPSLEEELARLKAELLRPTLQDDPFADGRVPDLVVLSTTDVGGEVAPCG